MASFGEFQTQHASLTILYYQIGARPGTVCYLYARHTPSRMPRLHFYSFVYPYLWVDSGDGDLSIKVVP